MVGIDKKPSFLLKNIYTYNLQHLAALKTLNTCGGVTLALIFSKNIILHCSPFLCSLSKECFILNENQLCAIQNHWMSVNIIVCSQKRGEGCFLFHLLFRVAAVSFKPVLVCYGLFGVVLFFTRNDITDCFDLQISYKST